MDFALNLILKFWNFQITFVWHYILSKKQKTKDKLLITHIEFELVQEKGKSISAIFTNSNQNRTKKTAYGKEKKRKENQKKDGFPPFLYFRKARIFSIPTIFKNKSKSVFTGQRNVLIVNEDIAVDETSEATADQGSNPVDPVAVVVAADHGGAKGASRVHWPTGEWSGGQDIGSDDKSNGDGCDCAQWTLFGVSCCGVHCVD